MKPWVNESLCRGERRFVSSSQLTACRQAEAAAQDSRRLGLGWTDILCHFVPVLKKYNQRLGRIVVEKSVTLSECGEIESGQDGRSTSIILSLSSR